MQTRICRVPLLALTTGLCLAPAAGQMFAPTSPAGLGGSTLYRLEAGSTYQRGCFDPCDCPLMEEVPLLGTFRLGAGQFDGLFTNYPVEEVNWRVEIGGELHIVGSGTYRVGGEFAQMHQLKLDLRIGDEPTEHFDSGLIVGGGEFPDIDIIVSIRGMFCFDTVLHVIAAPVPAREVTRYRLAGSLYVEGCFGGCLCPVSQAELTGTFGLVRLSSNPLFDEYAVVDVRWQHPGPGSDVVTRIRGAGFYRIGGEVAIQHQMTLWLTLGGGPLTRFDSGWIVGGGNFPAIDISMNVHGLVCYDQVIDLHAAP